MLDAATVAIEAVTATVIDLYVYWKPGFMLKLEAWLASVLVLEEVYVINDSIAWHHLESTAVVLSTEERMGLTRRLEWIAVVDLSAVSVDVLNIASEIGCASVATGTGLVLVTVAVGINDLTTVAIGDGESPVDNIFNDSMTLTVLTITTSSAWQQLESTVWWYAVGINIDSMDLMTLTVCLCERLNGSTTTQEVCSVGSVKWTVWLDNRLGSNGLVLDSAVAIPDAECGLVVHHGSAGWL